MSNRLGVWITQNETLVVGLEYDGDVVFIHHDIFKWGKSALKQLDASVEEACKEVQKQGFKELWSYFKPNQNHLFKFCDRYGFEVVNVLEDEILVMKELTCQH